MCVCVGKSEKQNPWMVLWSSNCIVRFSKVLKIVCVQWRSSDLRVGPQSGRGPGSQDGGDRLSLPVPDQEEEEWRRGAGEGGGQAP